MAVTHKQPIIWKKRILVPFWILRICIMIFIIGIYSWAIKWLSDDPNFATPNKAAVAIFMLFIVAVLLVDVLAILLFLRDALHPGTFLSMNCFQTGFWVGVLILDIVGVARGSSAAGIGFTIFVLLTFVALLIYSIVGYRKMKKQAQRGNYTAALNPAAVPAPGYHPPAYTNAAPYQSQSSPYAYGPQGGVAPVELHAPPHYGHQAGSVGNYYQEAPVKPAQMV